MKCQQCGAIADNEALARRQCRYCNAVLVPPARAPVPDPQAMSAQQVAMMNELMADRNHNGIPDVMEPAIAMANAAQAQVRQQRLLTVMRGARNRLADRLRFSISYMAIKTVFLSFFLSLAWTIASSVAEIDPWFGAHAGYFCPRVCEGCTGPYVSLSWSTTTNNRSRSSHSNVYCRHPQSRIGSMNWGEMMSAREAHERYELSGGYFTIFATVWASLLLLTLPLGALWERAAVGGRKRRVAVLDAEIARAEQNIQAAPVVMVQGSSHVGGPPLMR